MSDKVDTWAISRLLMPDGKLVDLLCREGSEQNSKKFIPGDDFDMAIMEEFGERLEDYEFAVMLYASFLNNNWINKDETKTGGGGTTFRCAAGFIASYRGKGENYLDFYMKNDDVGILDGYVSPEIKEGMMKHGWYVNNGFPDE